MRSFAGVNDKRGNYGVEITITTDMVDAGRRRCDCRIHGVERVRIGTELSDGRGLIEVCRRVQRGGGSWQPGSEVADKFLSNDVSISPTHTMADLFELALVQDDVTITDLLDANNICIGALALSWEVHEGFTPDATWWLIRVQSVEETGGDAEYLSLFEYAGDAENAASDARFGELAKASGATPNALSELLEGVE